MENYLDDISYENYPAFYKDNEGSSVICKPEFLYSLISEIMSTVDDLNLDQLKVLRQRIDDIILNKTQQNHIEEIKNQVSLKGYYCDPEFTKNIPGLKYMSLPLYINIYTHNKEDFSDCHVSGLIGSPTVPNKRNDERSYLSGHSLPNFTNIRIAVGAVYKIVILYWFTSSQIRPGFG